MLYLFRRLGPRLAKESQPLPTLSIPWGKPKRSRADLAAMCRIPAGLDAAEQAWRIRAFTLSEPGFPTPQIVG